MKPRTRARSIALQVLYETDLANHLPVDVLKARLDEVTLPDDLLEFLASHPPADVLKARLAEMTLPDDLTESLETHPTVETLKEWLAKTRLTDDLAEFAREIIFGVIPFSQDIDQLIVRYAPEWPLDQIAIIDRNILRIAFWEFAISRETPVKVAINEAVELAKLYGSDAAPRFVNGVLGALADHDYEIKQIIKDRIARETK